MRFTSIVLAVGFCLGMTSAVLGGGPVSDRLTLSAAALTPKGAASVGPFVVQGPDSTSSLRLQFAGQLRMQFESKDQGSGKERLDQVTMQARRIRTTAAVGLPRYGLSFKLQLSFAPDAAEMMDAFFDYDVLCCAKLRFGQFKVPFTRYRVQSFQRLTFADWAIVTKYFGAERQMGFAVHNGYEKPPVWGYVAGVFTGVNARASHGVGMDVLYGEVAPNPSLLVDPGPRGDFHPEIVVHGSYNPQNMSVASDSDEKDKGLRWFAALSAAWDLDPIPYQDFTARVAPELLIKYRGMSFDAVGYAGWADIDGGCVTKKAMLGGLVQSSYRINKRFELAARYAIVDFDDSFVESAYFRAQDLIAAAEAAVDAASEKELAEANLSEIIAQYKNTGKVSREQEATVGVNIYIDGHSLKWQNDAGWLIHTRTDGSRTDFVARSQFQLAF